LAGSFTDRFPSSATGPVVFMTLHFVAQIALVLACLVASAQCYQGNCTTDLQSPVIVVSPSGSTVLHLFGARGTLDAAYHGVIYPESFRLNLTFLGAAERNKSLDSTGLHHTCTVPTGFGSAPNDTTNDGSPVGPIIRYLDALEIDCYVYPYEKFINNTRVQGGAVRYSSPVMPTLHLVLAYEFAEGEIEVLSSDLTNFTKGIPYYYHWQYVANHEFPLAFPPVS